MQDDKIFLFTFLVHQDGAEEVWADYPIEPDQEENFQPRVTGYPATYARLVERSRPCTTRVAAILLLLSSLLLVTQRDRLLAAFGTHAAKIADHTSQVIYPAHTNLR